MKQRILAALALVLLVAAAANAKGGYIGMTQQTTSDGDSLGATADTTTAERVSQGMDTINFAVVTDSVAIYKIQVSPNNSDWYTVDTDTTVNATLEFTGDLAASIAPGWYTRMIVDGTWTTGKKTGKAWLNFTQ